MSGRMTANAFALAIVLQACTAREPLPGQGAATREGSTQSAAGAGRTPQAENELTLSVEYLQPVRGGLAIEFKLKGNRDAAFNAGLFFFAELLNDPSKWIVIGTDGGRELIPLPKPDGYSNWPFHEPRTSTNDAGVSTVYQRCIVRMDDGGARQESSSSVRNFWTLLRASLRGWRRTLERSSF